MVLKKVDNRIRSLIEDSVAKRHRSVFVVVGERARDQVVILHHILSKAQIKARPSVLWCYKKELGFTSHRQKQVKKLRKKMRAGQLDPNENGDPFEMFITTTQIRYCYYAETEKILGNTFGMCVLQDFESLTPNILARTVETVEGGGIVVILLNEGLEQLKQLSNRVSTSTSSSNKETKKNNPKEANNDSEQDEDENEEVADKSISSRFNKRFLLSLGDCNSCLVLDDQLNVLPIFAQSEKLNASPQLKPGSTGSSDPQLVELKSSLAGTQPAAALSNQCCTLDQAKATLRCIDVLADAPNSSTAYGSGVVVSLTAGRGRGKSASLGLSIAAAVALGYSNILVTSPAVENVRTLFDFVQKGLNALNYEKHIDYDVVSGQIVAAPTSASPGDGSSSNKAVVRIAIFRERRRQSIVFMTPDDALRQVSSPSQRFGAAASMGAFDLVLIDEAAAIPLPKVRSLIAGAPLTFMASTISGYEGTGRSLSLKLIHQLRNLSSQSSQGTIKTTSSKRLHELKLAEPIRYGIDDPVEKWLTRFLCLDVTDIEVDSPFPTKSSCPPPDACELFYVNRDTLFSYHRSAEKFLNRIWSLYVAAHYKNSPNDMQLLADAPAHHIFVLLAPLPADSKASELPDVLCVIQVALEGRVAKSTVMASLARGRRPAGDLVPWTLSQQYQDTNFATSLSGARIVRIATNPDFAKMGYGSRAIKQLADYYAGKLYVPSAAEEAANSSSGIPPLLSRLCERRPDGVIDYLSVSYGLGFDGQLFRFWRRAQFVPLYLRQTASDVTGEHSCIMLRALPKEDDDEPNSSAVPTWLQAYAKDFRRRLLSLFSLSFAAEKFPPLLALDMVDCVSAFAKASDCAEDDADKDSTSATDVLLTPHDLKRLSAYASNQVDHHLITDLLPSLAWLYFLGLIDKTGKTTVSRLQEAILLCLGIQRRTIDAVASALSPPPPADPLPASQVLALLCRAVRKLLTCIETSLEQRLDSRVPSNGSNKIKPTANGKQNNSNDAEETEDLNDQTANQSAQGGAKAKFDVKALEQFAIRGTDEEWAEATASASMLREGKQASGFISVKSKISPSPQKRRNQAPSSGGKQKKKHH